MTLKKIGVLLVLNAISYLTFAQADNVGAGQAIQFDGVDDYVVIGKDYSSLNLPFTVSAWVRIDENSNFVTPIFVTNDNNPIYRGFWFVVTPTVLLCEFGDGTGASNPAFRRGKSATVPNLKGRWVNVCAVMASPFDVRLYVNGNDVGGSNSGASNLTMRSAFSGDVPKIGYFLSNGVEYRDKSIIDEIRLWNRALSTVEIRQNMCLKLNGNESGLIGYWDFNETSGSIVFDKSSKKADGQLVGNPTRVFSGAPIGDVSVNNYPATNTSITAGAYKVE
ncbi:MAG: LamG domain-containing protein, partial [Flammeovirgaceae bacterium]